MSGMNDIKQLDNTPGVWNFVVRELLEPFINEQDGYIVRNKGALNYVPQACENTQDLSVTDKAVEHSETQLSSNDVQEEEHSGYVTAFLPSFIGINLANVIQNSGVSFNSALWKIRYLMGDTLELTSDKVIAVQDFVTGIIADAKKLPMVQKIFLYQGEEKPEAAANEKNINTELEQIKIIIELLILHANKAKLIIDASISTLNQQLQANNKNIKHPASADKLLNICDTMLKWMNEEVIMLRTCLAFESETEPVKKDNKLALEADDLEKKIVIFLFEKIFLIKLNEVRSNILKEKYSRIVPENQSNEIISAFKDMISNFNDNYYIIKPLLKVENLLAKVDDARNMVKKSLENTRVASMFWSSDNEFLTEIGDGLRELHVDLINLKSKTDVYLNDRNSKNLKSRLITNAPA